MSHSINLFKVVVAQRGALDVSNAHLGFVTDFNPTASQLNILREMFQPVPIITLFSVEERATASLEALLTKQILHYFEVYGLGMPGLFELECSKGHIATIALIRAVTVDELTTLIHDLIYANRPIADATAVVDLIREHRIPYDINLVRNNELRIVLFDPRTDRFTSGDDAVRYICYHATKSPMLIKSQRVISEVQKNPIGERFLSEHILPLAQVFNRHERLILACKSTARTVVNRISKMSKRHHVPMVEPMAKRFIATALKQGAILSWDVTLRDLFKYLNLIEYRQLGLSTDTFIIRNGKMWTEANRPIVETWRLVDIKTAVLTEIRRRLTSLDGRRILLDAHVDYGLPISRKQCMGQLPFGTRVEAAGKDKLSAGIYWDDRKTGRRTDLDLSAINDLGERTGWGQMSGYERDAPIVFSGDVTAAPRGASEFMVMNPSKPNRYGLMVNIFAGPTPPEQSCPAEIVVGYPSHSGRDAVWQDRTLIREAITLQARQTIIGFLKDNAFIVYAGQLSSKRTSGGRPAILDKAFGELWTVEHVLYQCGISYDKVPQPGVVYDVDLRYPSFTMDKLERLFGI